MTSVSHCLLLQEQIVRKSKSVCKIQMVLVLGTRCCQRTDLDPLKLVNILSVCQTVLQQGWERMSEHCLGAGNMSLLMCCTVISILESHSEQNPFVEEIWLVKQLTIFSDEFNTAKPVNYINSTLAESFLFFFFFPKSIILHECDFPVMSILRICSSKLCFQYSS